MKTQSFVILLIFNIYMPKMFDKLVLGLFEIVENKTKVGFIVNYI